MPASALLTLQTHAGIHAAKQPCTLQIGSFFYKSDLGDVWERQHTFYFGHLLLWQPLVTYLVCLWIVSEWRSHKVAEAGRPNSYASRAGLELLIPTTVSWLLGMWACTAMPCYEHICLWYFKPWSLSVWSGVCGDLFTLHQDQRFNILHFTFILVYISITCFLRA